MLIYGLWSLRNECWLTYGDICRVLTSDTPCAFRTEAEAEAFYRAESPDWDGQLAEARDEHGGFVVRPLPGLQLTMPKESLERLYDALERRFCGEGQDMRLYACFVMAARERELITDADVNQLLTLASGRMLHHLANPRSR